MGVELVLSIDAGMQNKSIFGDVQIAELQLYINLNVHLPIPAIQMVTWSVLSSKFELQTIDGA